jgi:hypothetical protein
MRVASSSAKHEQQRVVPPARHRHTGTPAQKLSNELPKTCNDGKSENRK